MRQLDLFSKGPTPMPARIRKVKESPVATQRNQKASYRALPLSQSKRRFYYCTIPIEELFPLCFVSRRLEDPITGFQRTLNKSRALDIANYLKAGTIPGNVVLSAQPEAKVKFNARAGSVSYTPIEGRTFMVLDGQHRLWGYEMCTIKHRVPVAIYFDLELKDETRLFIDINSLQKGVPANLLLDIKAQAEIESQRDGILRELFDRLNADPRSPLNGRLTPAEPKRNMISRVTFNRAVGDSLLKGAMAGAERHLQLSVLINYLNAFDAELEDEVKSHLVKPAYFEAIFVVFNDVVGGAYRDSGNVKQATLQDIIRPAAKISHTTMRKKEIAAALSAALNQSVELTEGNV